MWHNYFFYIFKSLYFIILCWLLKNSFIQVVSLCWYSIMYYIDICRLFWEQWNLNFSFFCRRHINCPFLNFNHDHAHYLHHSVLFFYHPYSLCTWFCNKSMEERHLGEPWWPNPPLQLKLINDQLLGVFGRPSNLIQHLL